MLSYIHQIHNLFWRLKIPLLYSVCLQGRRHRGAKKEKKETKGKKKEFQDRRNEKNYGGGGGLGVYKKILTNLVSRLGRSFN